MNPVARSPILAAMSDSTGNRVLITGAGQRIGRTIALDLATCGWAVAVHYNTSSDPAAAVVDEIVEAGGRASMVAADLADEAQSQALISRASDALGPITCLINNASVFREDTTQTATRNSWDLHMEVNLRAPFVLTQTFARQLPQSRAGNVINIVDQRVWNLGADYATYTLSKIGLWGLTQTTARALAPNIRVNAIGPGPTLPHSRQSEDGFVHHWRATPLGRQVTPEDICHGVRYILDATTMTGQMIALDAGEHLGGEHK